MVSPGTGNTADYCGLVTRRPFEARGYSTPAVARHLPRRVQMDRHI